MSYAKDTRATIIPAMRYRDAVKAVDWLCEAFGFEKHLVIPGPENTIVHAQLSFGNGMIMLGSVSDTEFGKFMTQPDEIGGRETQSAYVVVSDCDAHYVRAKQAGAQIVRELRTEEYGGKGYACKDLEGHLWSFGSFDPWEAPA